MDHPEVVAFGQCAPHGVGHDRLAIAAPALGLHALRSAQRQQAGAGPGFGLGRGLDLQVEIGRASCRERVYGPV